MAEYLDNVLVKVTKLLDLGLPWEQTEERVKHILETRDEEQNLPFELIHENRRLNSLKNKPKYPLLVGFCYNLGIGTTKDEKNAFNHWEEDTTSYGHYLIGRCYCYGLGVDIDYSKMGIVCWRWQLIRPKWAWILLLQWSRSRSGFKKGISMVPKIRRSW